MRLCPNMAIFRCSCMIQRLTLYSGSLFCGIKYRDKTTILFFQSVVKTNIDPFTILRSLRISVNEKGQQKRQFPTFFCIYRSIKALPKTDRMIILTFSAPAFIQRLQISKLHTRAFAAHFSIKKQAEPAFTSAEVRNTSKSCSRGRFYAISYTLKKQTEPASTC